jgi:hypothetical protein
MAPFQRSTFSPISEVEAIPPSTIASLPNLSDIETELRSIFQKSATSKARLQKSTQAMKESNAVVETLEQELNDAKAKQVGTKKRLDAALRKRESEAERLEVRKLHLKIVKECLETEHMEEIMHLNNKNGGANYYKKLSRSELKVIRKRLQDIQELFTKAKKVEESKIYEKRAQADLMKRDAVSKYILFQKYSQI